MLPALAPLVITMIVHALIDPSALPGVLASAGLAGAWGLSLAAGMVAVALFARPRGRQWIAVGVVAVFVMLTSLSGRLETLPFFAGSSWNWQGKILDLLWVGIVMAILYRWAREETGLRWRLQPGSMRIALIMTTGVFVLFIGLWLVAVAIGEDPAPRADLEQFAWDATIPNLTEELIWRGVMLAVLDRAFPPRRHVLGAPMGWGVVITSIGFGLGHTILLGADGSWAFSLGGGLFATAMGFAFGWIRARTGSIWPAFALHCAPELGVDVGSLLTS